MTRITTVAKWKDDKSGFYPIDPNTNDFVKLPRQFQNLVYSNNVADVNDDPAVSKLTFTTDPSHPDKAASVPCCIDLI